MRTRISDAVAALGIAFIRLAAKIAGGTVTVKREVPS